MVLQKIRFNVILGMIIAEYLVGKIKNKSNAPHCCYIFGQNTMSSNLSPFLTGGAKVNVLLLPMLNTNGITSETLR